MSATAQTPPPERTIASIDLAKAFGTSEPWRLIATQGGEIDDPITGDGKVPGTIRLCLTKDDGRSCETALAHALRIKGGDDLFSDPHFLNRAEIVWPAGRTGAPALLVQAASLSSVNGDQRIATMLLRHDKTSDRIVPAYQYRTGHNNNQEVRYVAASVLRGDVIVADSDFGPPFTYWITVSRPGKDGRYQQALRFRSFTRYGDGNPLAVIDSEMPNIQRRLGLWHRPHLLKGALWCQ